jgi:hypothetical protein
MNRLVAFALSIALASASAACSDDTPASPKASTPSVVFEPAQAPEAPAITIDAAEVSTETLVLDVTGHGLSSVYGVAFRLRYDPGVLALVEMKPAATWSKAAPIAAAREGAPGLLVAGVSATSEFSGMDVDASALATITFDVVAPKPTPLDFVIERSVVATADGGELAGVTWAGGALVAP